MEKSGIMVHHKRLFPCSFSLSLMVLMMLPASFSFSQSFTKDDCSGSLGYAYYAYSMARIYFNHKMLDRSEEMLREALIVDFCSSSLYSEAADLFLKMGKEEEAEAFSSRSLEINPEDVMGLKIQALLKGMRALMLKDGDLLDRSLILCQKAIQKDPRDSRLYSLFIKLDFEKGNMERAAKTLDHYFSAFQANLDPIFLVADIIKDSGKSAQLDRFFHSFLSQKAISTKIILMIGNLLERSGYLRLAQHLYHEASLKYQDNDLFVKDAFILYELGDYEESIKAISQIKGILRDEDDIIRLLANAQRKIGHIDQALDLYQKLFKRNPHNGSLIAEMAEFYESIGDIRHALSYFKLALSLLPESSSSSERDSSHLSLSLRIALLSIEEKDYRSAREILRQSKKYGSEKEVAYYIVASKAEGLRSAKRALKIIKKGQKLFHEHPALMVREAEIYLTIDKEKAKELLKRTLSLTNHSKEQYLSIAATLREAHQYQMAEEFLQEALSSYPDSDLFLEMGSLMERWKRYQEAETFLKKSIERDPSNAIALNYLGYMLAEQSNRYQEALSYVQRAITLDPYNGAYLDSLGFIYLKLGRIDLAEKNILAAAEIYPFDPEIRDHLGDLYYALGDVEKAIEEWTSALQLNIESRQKVTMKIMQAKSDHPFHEE